MSPKQTMRELPNEKLSEILERYDQERLVISLAYADAGIDPLWPRFESGVLNQISEGDAMASRYAIWANTVRDNIIAGMKAIESGDKDKAHQHFVRAANSMSAFADVQAYFDPFNLGEKT